LGVSEIESKNSRKKLVGGDCLLSTATLTVVTSSTLRDGVWDQLQSVEHLGQWLWLHALSPPLWV
jgi:hypothetical protein